MFSAVNMGRKSTKSDCKLVLVDMFGFEQPYGYTCMIFRTIGISCGNNTIPDGTRKTEE